jgi:hypothetical protein
MNVTNSTRRQESDELPFEIRAVSALGISIVADALDYVGAPIFALPIIGDIADLIVSGLPPDKDHEILCHSQKQDSRLECKYTAILRS